jgi:hypothetical protein
MVAFSEIIDFLLDLLQDEGARAEFEQDPDGALARAGLDGVTGQDVRDARLQLADSGDVSAVDDGAGSSYPDGDDPIREINYTTRHYQADDTAQPDDGDGDGPDLNLVQQDSSVVTIDDRDSFFFQSFTSDDDVTIIDDSFNEGSFNEGSFNQDNDVLAIQDNSVVNEDNDVTIDADNSFNEDNDVTAIQDNDTVNENTDVRILNADGSFNDAVPADPGTEPDPPAAEPVEPDVGPGIEEPGIEEPGIEEPGIEEFDTSAADAAAEAEASSAADDAAFDDATADDADLDVPADTDATDIVPA